MNEPWQPHDVTPGVEETFSPGAATPAPETPAPSSTRGRAPQTVHIVEILADPPSTQTGDENRDGERSTYADEFIELLNVVSVAVDMSD